MDYLEQKSKVQQFLHVFYDEICLRRSAPLNTVTFYDLLIDTERLFSLEYKNSHVVKSNNNEWITLDLRIKPYGLMKDWFECTSIVS